MFTLAQIQAAHAQVKSGADFPAYIKALKQLGVLHYETFVTDDHTTYTGATHEVTSPASSITRTITSPSQPEAFKTILKNHQEGKTDYPTFCQQCAETGIEKWQVSLESMTCTYVDCNHNEILVEGIPS
jgi:uncharacterized protein YbcV (DUF1398 family)